MFKAKQLQCWQYWLALLLARNKKCTCSLNFYW